MPELLFPWRIERRSEAEWIWPKRLKRSPSGNMFPWRDAAGALNETVTEALSDHASSQSAALVGAPFSGHAETLSVLAETAGWRLIAPPGPEQVLAGDARWIDTFAQGSAPWAMPMLERCFLRHAKGLDLIRRLLEAYVAGRLGRGVLGCGSWGWSFLQKACAETDAIQAVTSQALDARRLRRWFSDLACRKPFCRNCSPMVRAASPKCLFSFDRRTLSSTATSAGGSRLWPIRRCAPSCALKTI